MHTLYTLTSSLHSEAACSPAEEGFIREIEAMIGERFCFMGEDFSGYGGDTEQPHICPDRGH